MQRYEISLHWKTFQCIVRRYFQHEKLCQGYSDKGTIIYYVTIATVICSGVKITCYFHAWIYIFFPLELTWYVVGVYVMNDNLLPYVQLSSLPILNTCCQLSFVCNSHNTKVSETRKLNCNIWLTNITMVLFLQLVLPEYGIHLFISLFLLAGGQWMAFIFNLPLLIYNIFRYSHGLQYFELSFVIFLGLLTQVSSSSWWCLHLRESFNKFLFGICQDQVISE